MALRGLFIGVDRFVSLQHPALTKGIRERIDTPPLASIAPGCVKYWSGHMTAAVHPALRAVTVA
jgi:hypothetical protein